MRGKNYLIVYLVVSLLMPTSIFGWGYATHAYFADHLGKSGYYLNLQEVYGAMAPDMFKPLAGSPYFSYLELQTHQQFDKVANHARTEGLKAFAYGFASHNEIWGADYTAHHEGRTTPGIGYVTAQVNVLAPAFQDSIERVLLANNIDPAQAKEIAAEFAPGLAHSMVEVAVDILIKRNTDSKVGTKILQAAQLRSPAVAALLVAAYANDFAKEFDLKMVMASGIIIGAERAFKEFMSYYGYVFTRKESEIIKRLSVYGAELAEFYIKTIKNLDIKVPSKSVADLIALAIVQIESSYAAEIAATLAYLENEMPSQGIKPRSQFVALQNEAALEHPIESIPGEFSLAQNYPNPFNPTTTINYSLAKDSQVRLTVYNTLGQVIAVLVDGFQPKGLYQVNWDAHYQPSGLYIYRLEADGFTASKKMFLQK